LKKLLPIALTGLLAWINQLQVEAVKSL